MVREENASDDEHQRREMRLLKSRIDSLESNVIALQYRKWEGLLGDNLQGMLASEVLTEQSLSNPDPTIRAGAFSLIASHWGPKFDAVDVYKNAVLRDEDLAVRAGAIGCLAILFADTEDHATSVLLARIVRDESNQAYLRRDAYIALAYVQGVKISHDDLMSLLSYKDQFPVGIDWKLVDSCLRD